MDLADLRADIIRRAGKRERFMVAIAGPPASGKSTTAHDLQKSLVAAGETAVVVPMDGFHFDDAVLNARGHRPRKGAPFTFDAAGFEHLLRRIRDREPDIAIPVFDRSMELSRAAADIVGADTRFILVEGNYLLLDEAPWTGLRPLFDLTVFIDVAHEELRNRLIQRWLDHGFDMAYARNWIATNDDLNIAHVLAHRAPADVVLTQD
ncbi:MAG: nucleoside/nucleotide kinase family protein [Hyphomicrobiales bacterium]